MLSETTSRQFDQLSTSVIKSMPRVISSEKELGLIEGDSEAALEKLQKADQLEQERKEREALEELTRKKEEEEKRLATPSPPPPPPVEIPEPEVMEAVKEEPEKEEEVKEEAPVVEEKPIFDEGLEYGHVQLPPLRSAPPPRRVQTPVLTAAPEDNSYLQQMTPQVSNVFKRIGVPRLIRSFIAGQVLATCIVKASAPNNENAKELLDVLEQLSHIKATGELLKFSDIGKVVGKLRTFSDKQVSQKAKEIVKKWKHDVVSNDPTTHSNPSSRRSSAASNASSSHNNKQQPSSTASSPMSITTETVKRTVKSDEVDFESTGQGPRDKTIELMYASIGLGSFAASDLLLKRAIAIENNMYEIFSSVNEEYKSKARSMVSNLKNKSNQSLRDDVVTGEISVDTLCTMSAEDMASEESKARDRKLAEEALFKARGAESAQAETDMFKCGKCRGRRCTYFQMQTRSADEPMTTFVTCVNCGNHWKFC
ncbi:unnamed protein product [Mucor hiemalis]